MKRRDIFRGFAGLVGAAAVAPLVPQFAAGGVVAGPITTHVFDAEDFVVLDSIASRDGAMIFDVKDGVLTMRAAQSFPGDRG